MPMNWQMLYTAVHVIGRTTQGTGFIVTVPSEVDGHLYGYAVTAHHVVNDQEPVYVQATNCFGTGELYQPRLVTDWSQPIDGLDLAVAPFDPRPGEALAGTPWADLIPTTVIHDGSMTVFGPVLGGQVFYVGLFAPAGRMLARSGTIAALDVEDLDLKGYRYTCHLLDCRSFGGFSGSPCFLVTSYAALKDTPLPLAHRFPDAIEKVGFGGLLHVSIPCGMFTAHYDDSDDPVANPSGAASRYGIGVMLRSNEIKEALMTDDLRKQRREEDTLREAEGKRSKIVPKPASGTLTSIDATADLLGKLLEVPKDEARTD